MHIGKIISTCTLCLASMLALAYDEQAKMIFNVKNHSTQALVCTYENMGEFHQLALEGASTIVIPADKHDTFIVNWHWQSDTGRIEFFSPSKIGGGIIDCQSTQNGSDEQSIHIHYENTAQLQASPTAIFVEFDLLNRQTKTNTYDTCLSHNVEDYRSSSHRPMTGSAPATWAVDFTIEPKYKEQT